MKKSVKKSLLLAAIVAMLLSVLAPAASAKSRGDTLAAAPVETDQKICIIDGANICPPEPWEHIAICITTSMLAGTECPHPFEDSDNGRIDSFARATKDDGRGTHQAALPQGNCVGVNTCNNFIAECIGAGGHFDEEHHNPQGQPNLGSCKPGSD